MSPANGNKADANGIRVMKVVLSLTVLLGTVVLLGSDLLMAHLAYL
jgi:hypothetical protein